jgi:4-oxalocrotonate tautomerase
MPFVSIKISGPTLAVEQVRQLQQRTTDLLNGALGKNADLASVVVEQVAVPGWAVGRTPARVAAHLEAKVTAGTNTSEEKARFIAEADSLLRRVLGPELSVATYIVVAEVASDAWGYGGLTQEQRRQEQTQAV